MNQNQSCAAAKELLENTERARLMHFGIGEYGTILKTQERLRAAREQGEVVDTWMIGEHPTVITQGVRGIDDDVKLDSAIDEIPIYHIDRGGMTTLHSPGQLIVYPIVKVRGGSLAAGRLARALLMTMQAWLRSEFGVEAAPLPRQPGLFVEGRKLLSIGISVRRGISMHGIAMNLCSDLSLWKWIVACGEPTTSPISLSELLGRKVEPKDQVDSLREWLVQQWGYGRVDLQDTGRIE